MGRVRSCDTGPERVVRSLLTKMGLRYRLQRKDLPGRPDIAFVGRKKAIFVHGCFWHGHHCRRGARAPKTNSTYWLAKITRNRARDDMAVRELDALGWQSLTLWECELRDEDGLRHRLALFLSTADADCATS